MTDHDAVIAELEARLEAARAAREASVTPFRMTVALDALRKNISESMAAVGQTRMAGADVFYRGALLGMTAELLVDPTDGSYQILSVTHGDQVLTPAADEDHVL